MVMWNVDIICFGNEEFVRKVIKVFIFIGVVMSIVGFLRLVSGVEYFFSYVLDMFFDKFVFYGE